MMNSIRRIDTELFETLFSKATQSDRKRSHHMFHHGAPDKVQRMLICLKTGTYIRPHRHVGENRWELLLAVRGRMAYLSFDDNGIVVGRIELSPGESTSGLEVPGGTWHSTVALEDNSAFFEVKEGPYDPDTYAEFAEWAPEEGAADAADFVTWMAKAMVGENR